MARNSPGHNAQCILTAAYGEAPCSRERWGEALIGHRLLVN